ncbi:TolC family protein [Denitromonas iodatirespirans]|uniref:TolC family protein n=1 Tax=Denitromonas iodatirespirans TaxID=2795389 RepID=A0A944DDG0_DENI1|nr:TolC family protein [Denitromonas iodatirespirans]MBT0963031.1 TolC family protein [Denitromonas iodatirespirans]MCZ4307074.1 TolC family protein [Zoogloeaceae bacterium G21618-S1]
MLSYAGFVAGAPVVLTSLLMVFSPAVLAEVSSPDGESAASTLTSEVRLRRPDLTLTEAIERAMASNPALAAQRREVAARQGERVQAGLLPNPSLSMLLEDTRSATRTTTIQIDQRIELGGKRSARVDVAAGSVKAADADLAARTLVVRSEVAATFYAVLAGQERVALTDELVVLAGRALIAATKRVAAGKAAPLEASRAKIAEASARMEQNQAQSALAVQRRRLAATWAGSDDGFGRVTGQTVTGAVAMAWPQLLSRLDQAPQMLSARHALERSQSAVVLERAKRTPDLTVSLGNIRAEEVGRNQALIGLSIEIPLFDRNQGNILAATQRAGMAADEVDALRAKLQADLFEAYQQLLVAQQSATTLEADVVPAALSAFRAAVIGFELGKFSFLDVLDAQRSLSQARSRHIETLTEISRAVAQIERVLGPQGSAAPSVH